MAQTDDRLRAALEDRLRFETLITDLSARFVNLDPDLIDGAIQDAQRLLVDALDLDRSSLFQFSDDRAGLTFTHYWSRPGFPPPPMNANPAELFPWATAQILKGEMISFSSVNELPPDVPDRENMVRIGTKSNVTLPLVASGRVVGALTFASMRAERPWPAEIINRLSVVGQVFANALARKLTETELRRVLAENARLRDRLTSENVYLRSEAKARRGSREITGESLAMRRVQEQIEQVAPTGSTVLLFGETGTGKELIAAAIHDRSPRAGRAMVRVNCAAIPAGLIESELFGREKGAYTGATTRQIGRFEVADDSTIFLDEVGELPGDVQVKLLRVLEERQIERLGSSRPVDISVRVIAATNRDLERAVADRTFREDLYYRLNVFPITVPPLRERLEDIPILTWSFVKEFAKALGKRIESISKEQILALQRYGWPGNVRELRNVIERAVIVSTGPRLVVEPPRARLGTTRRSVRLAEVERDHIRAVLERAGWRVRGRGGAAELLGLKPSTLEGRMTKLEIRRPRH
jgi:transcriptional regulator with GAF, ATPase, and Fis domain